MVRSLAAIVAVAALAAPASAAAATWGVNNTTDTPVGQACSGFTNCSLREAVTSTEANPGLDAILVSPGTYPLTNGQLTVTQPLSVSRVGAGVTRIDAQSSSRIFDVTGGTFDVRFMTLVNGKATGTAAAGGAIRSTGAVTIGGSSFQNNSAVGTDTATGGAISVAGALTMDNGGGLTANSFSGNSATAPTSAAGGAVYAAAGATISDSTFSSNTISSDGNATGGALDVEGNATLARVTATTNTATSTVADAYGGALALFGATVTLSASTVSNSTATANSDQALGGGVAYLGATSLQITNTRLSANTATSGITASGGGLGVSGDGATTVTGSTIDANTATTTSGVALGGGVVLFPGSAATLTLTNSTVTGNAATVTAAGGFALGGGVMLYQDSTIVAATISGNRSEGVAGAGFVAGGGVAGASGGATDIALTGSILSGNTQPNADADCAQATLASGGGNVVNQTSGADSCAFTPGPTDVLSADPQLGALANHDGPTPTMLPAPTSPAFDRYTTSCPAVDQRAIARPQLAQCDSGAVELRPATFTRNPASRSFGSVTAGTTSVPQNVSVSNTGDIPAVPPAALGGPDPTQFTLSGCTTAIGFGENCFLAVRFAPTSAGAKSATVTGVGADVALSGTGVASLTADPTSQDFGLQTVDTSSAKQTFTVTADGTSEITTVVLEGANPGDFTLFGAGCRNVVLASGETCQVSAVFRPHSAGAKTATLRVAGPGEEALIALSGAGTTDPPLSLDPASWDFGSIFVGAAAPPKSFTITNSSDKPQTIEHVDLGGPDAGSFVRYAGQCLDVTLAPEETCTVSATFRPQSAGAKTAQLLVRTTGNPPQSIALSGVGDASTPLSFVPASWDFGAVRVGKASATKAFSVVNASGAPVTVTNVVLTTPDGWVGFLGGCRNAVLAPGASCAVSVRFAPTSPGAKATQIKFTTNAGVPQFIDLTGTGT